MLKWSMLQRFKLTEVNNNFTKTMHKKNEELMKSNRAMWDKQMVRFD